MNSYIGALGMAQGAEERALAAEERAEDAEAKARIDPISGLQSYVALQEAFSGLQGGEVENPRRRGDFPSGPHTLVVLDLDNFSDINTRYGHEGGNQVFRQVAGAIRSSIRDRDIAARITGGDEIAVLLPRVSGDKALEIAEKIRSSVEDGSEVTISAGVTTVEKDDTLKDSLGRGDRAAYAAKKQGRNRVVPFTPDLPEVPKLGD